MARISNYQDFWKYYVGEHSKRSTRVLHFVGTSLTFFLLATAITTARPKLLLLMPVAGYFFAWIGHLACEKNRPATFKYPVWSLVSDFKMYFLTITRKMGAEVAKYGKGDAL